VAVSVSPSSRGQTAITWGNGLPVVTALQFTRCRPSPDRWNAYAGGFYTGSPTACIQITVRLGARTTTMRVSIGRRCHARSENRAANRATSRDSRNIARANQAAPAADGHTEANPGCSSRALEQPACGWSIRAYTANGALNSRSSRHPGCRR
jgi:hypothetical protein